LEAFDVPAMMGSNKIMACVLILMNVRHSNTNAIRMHFVKIPMVHFVADALMVSMEMERLAMMLMSVIKIFQIVIHKLIAQILLVLILAHAWKTLLEMEFFVEPKHAWIEAALNTHIAPI